MLIRVFCCCSTSRTCNLTLSLSLPPLGSTTFIFSAPASTLCWKQPKKLWRAERGSNISHVLQSIVSGGALRSVLSSVRKAKSGHSFPMSPLFLGRVSPWCTRAVHHRVTRIGPVVCIRNLTNTSDQSQQRATIQSN
jgi:hypothetical protein